MANDRAGRSGFSPVGFAVIGSEMAGFTVAGVMIDWLAGTMPWATVGLTFFGFVAAFVHLTRIASRKRSGEGSERQ